MPGQPQYDRLQEANCTQQLRAAAEGLEQRAFLKEVRLLQMAMSYGDQEHSPAVGAEYFQRRADALLVPRCSNPIEERVADRLRKRLEHLLVLLSEEGVPADNSQAERDLCPAVIVRKIPCGNKTVPGEVRWEVPSSLADTCHKQKCSFIRSVAEAMPLAAPTPTIVA